MSEDIFPFAYVSISKAALFRAYSVVWISIPLSNLKEASVFSACLLAVFLTDIGSK